MNSLPTWAWGTLLVLLSPVFAFLLALALEILIDVLKETGFTGITAVLALLAAAGIGCLLFRKVWLRPPAAVAD